MIKAEELRVGNYVNVFDSITGNCYWKCTWNMIGSSDFLEPIPLQPEILQKAGFERVDKYLRQFKKYMNKIDSEAIILTTMKMDYEVIYEYNDMVAIKKRIAHLHTLQNLFFALTGEELMINL